MDPCGDDAQDRRRCGGRAASFSIMCTQRYLNCNGCAQGTGGKGRTRGQDTAIGEVHKFKQEEGRGIAELFVSSHSADSRTSDWWPQTKGPCRGQYISSHVVHVSRAASSEVYLVKSHEVHRKFDRYMQMQR